MERILIYLAWFVMPFAIRQVTATKVVNVVIEEIETLCVMLGCRCDGVGPIVKTSSDLRPQKNSHPLRT